MIHNQRFTLKVNKKESEKLLDKVHSFLKKKLGKKKYPLRYAIVEIKGNNATIEATILEDKK